MTGKNDDIDVSVVMVDWSVRESAHVLDYLAEQTVPRERYETIWIEFYDRRWEEIERRNTERARQGLPAAVDQWVVMDMPREVYYHKHVMYNLGIALASGRIIVIFDSDSMVSPTFIELIIRSFDDDPNIVLHMDQVRNHSDRFYPFNYPDWDDVTGEGAVNWTGETTTGIIDNEDPLHTRNYGGCMAALRKDVIAIGAADEHIDYLGYICGPYDMTFRLTNAGKREIWHHAVPLCHTWHPGQTGDNNYGGPHDGKHMSSTALSSRTTGRIQPLAENPVIKQLRLGETLTRDEIIRGAVRPEYLEQWRIDALGMPTREYDIGGGRTVRLYETSAKEHPTAKEDAPPTTQPQTPDYGPPPRGRLLVLLYLLGAVKMLRAIKTKLQLRRNRPGWGILGLLRKSLRPTSFLFGPSETGKEEVGRCWRCLCRCAERGAGRVLLYGMGEAAKVISVLAGSLPTRIEAVCAAPDGATRKLPGWRVVDERVLAEGEHPIIVASFGNIEAMRERLISLGAAPDRIMTL